MLKSSHKNPSPRKLSKTYFLQNKLLGAFIISSLVSANALAGAWVSKEGSGYGKLMLPITLLMNSMVMLQILVTLKV